MDRFAVDWRTAGLDAATTTLLEFVEDLTRSPPSCGPQHVERLRTAGFSDRAIHDAVQICGYFGYINRVAEGLGVEPEDWLDELGRLRQESGPQGSTP